MAGCDKEIMPVDIKVQIAKDQTTALLTIFVEEDEAKKAAVTVTELEIALSDAGVTIGIDKSILTDISENKLFNTQYTIAHCIPPTVGKNARVEILIKPKKKEDVPPAEDENGEIDYHLPRVGYITLCRQGDVLARWYASTRGEPGTSVHGEPIPGIMGKDISLELFKGAHTEVKSDELIAKEDGAVQIRGTQVRVDREFVINDHIGINTGSIDLPLDISVDIVVNGDVQRGFHVKCHSLIVSGCIEDSRIEVQKLKVTAGIVGTGDDPIIADEMKIGFINGNRLVEGKIVRIQREISNGATVSGIVVIANTLQGSTVYARDAAWVDNVNGKNTLVVGIDYIAKSEYDKIQRQLAGIQEPLEEMKEANYASAKKMKQLRELSKVNPKHPLLTKELPKIKELKDKLDRLTAIQSALKRRMEEVSKIMYSEGTPLLLVKGGFSKDASSGTVVPPDTLITMGHHTLKVDDPSRGAVFHVSDEHGVIQSPNFNVVELKTRIDNYLESALQGPATASPNNPADGAQSAASAQQATAPPTGATT